VPPSAVEQREEAMSTVLELADDTYQQFTVLAEQ
jgi:hypothetical protein